MNETANEPVQRIAVRGCSMFPVRGVRRNRSLFSLSGCKILMSRKLLILFGLGIVMVIAARERLMLESGLEKAIQAPMIRGLCSALGCGSVSRSPR
jgi:hypothetical protein